MIDEEAVGQTGWMFDAAVEIVGEDYPQGGPEGGSPNNLWYCGNGVAIQVGDDYIEAILDYDAETWEVNGPLKSQHVEGLSIEDGMAEFQNRIRGSL